tara:strand:- start:1821 stop:2489 length:669 start_codon:yes stop_codon:yes gene_type:complete
MLSSDVFNRKKLHGPEISLPTYSTLIGIVLSWGFLINWIIVRYVDGGFIYNNMPPIIFFILYFASCIYGVFLFNTSTDPSISFIGYNFVVLPFGLIVDIVIGAYAPGTVIRAIQTTAIMTFVMMAFGSLLPGLFKGINATLGLSLLAVIIAEMILIFVFGQQIGLIDWIVALIFCGYIGYDWGRALEIPRTVDNAIDSAAAIYMDIVNLFLRVLRILGSRKR